MATVWMIVSLPAGFLAAYLAILAIREANQKRRDRIFVDRINIMRKEGML
jgi:hypothetical protein